MSEKLIIAAISAGSALIIVILKDVIVWLWQNRKKKKVEDYQIYIKYALPLISSAEKLYWRLNEIVKSTERATFLQPTDVMTDFEDYKLHTTVYRLSAVLAWIRAFRKELFYKAISDEKHIHKIDKAIGEFQSSLADGPQVELQRMDSILRLLFNDAQPDTQAKSKVATRIDIELKRYLKRKGQNSLYKLNEEDRFEILSMIINEVSNGLNLAHVGESLIKKEIEQLTRIIEIKECWIYRDWQDAIGDQMLKEGDFGQRRFDVIGYREFQENIARKNSYIWIKRTYSLFEDLNLDLSDSHDARIEQIKKILENVKSLIKELSEGCKLKTSIT